MATQVKKRKKREWFAEETARQQREMRRQSRIQSQRIARGGLYTT